MSPFALIRGAMLLALVTVSLSVLGQDCAFSPDAIPMERPALRTHLAQCPTDAMALNNLGVLEEQAGNLDEAASAYQHASDLDPTMPEPLAGLGDVQFARKDKPLARQSYRRFIHLLERMPRASWTPVLEAAYPVYREKLHRLDQELGEKIVVKAASMVRGLTPSGLSRGIGFRPYTDVKIYFDTASHALSPDAREQLEQLAKALQSPGLLPFRFIIEGHTDDRGSEAYNNALSLRRAQRVLRALVEEYGVERGRLEAVGRGETVPVDSNETAIGRSLNRRVRLINAGRVGRP